MIQPGLSGDLQEHGYDNFETDERDFDLHTVLSPLKHVIAIAFVSRENKNIAYDCDGLRSERF